MIAAPLLLNRSRYGQVLLLSGEAGIGKSRLAQVFKEQTGERARHITLRCSPNHQKSAYYPLIQVLRRLCGIHAGDGPEALKKLAETVAPYRFVNEDTIPLLADVLGIASDDTTPGGDAVSRKQALFDTLTAWFIEEAAQQPVFMIVDDVHWMDPATHEFLSGFLDHVPSTPLMVILAYRADYSPPWPQRSYLNSLPLAGLDDAQMDAIMNAIAGEGRLTESLREYVREKTDGVPLYVEELTRALCDSLEDQESPDDGAVLIPAAGIPQTLHDSLEARLDGCPLGKEVAQCEQCGRILYFDE